MAVVLAPRTFGSIECQFQNACSNMSRNDSLPALEDTTTHSFHIDCFDCADRTLVTSAVALDAFDNKTPFGRARHANVAQPRLRPSSVSTQRLTRVPGSCCKWLGENRVRNDISAVNDLAEARLRDLVIEMPSLAFGDSDSAPALTSTMLVCGKLCPWRLIGATHRQPASTHT